MLSILGIDFEEKAFYNILKIIAIKYDFSYPEDKLLSLAKEVKLVVDDKSKYTDWNIRTFDINKILNKEFKRYKKYSRLKRIRRYR